jgi:tetratricopeptide (TPR) repeat protein
MNILNQLLQEFSLFYQAFLDDNPQVRYFMEEFTRQAGWIWGEIVRTTPASLKLALLVLAVLEVALIFSRVFIDSPFVSWILKILPKSLYRKTLIKRAERFAKNHKYLIAGKLYEAVDEHARAVAMYIKGEDFLQSGRVYVKIEKFREAARIYEEGKEFGEAAKYYEKEKLYAKAGEMYEKIKDFSRAAANLEKQVEELEKEPVTPERSKKIEEVSARGGDYFLKSKNFLSAGPLLEKASQFDKAAFAWSKAKNSLSTAKCLEMGSKFKEAAKIYMAEGKLEEAANCFEKGGSFFESGDIYKNLGNTDRAISQYQKVTSQSKNYDQASLILGDLFQQKGMLGPAKEKYQKLIERKGVSRENLEIFYNLALLTETTGHLHEAISLFEKIIAEDVSYKDVSVRLEQLKEKAQIASQLTPEESEAHTVTNRYKIIGELGRGGMGIVYRAEDTVLKRIVAYKSLPDTFKSNPQFLESFMQEARTAAALNHPNIVTIYDTGRVGNNYYITMECIDGITLKDLLVKTKGPVPIPIVMGIARQLCLGLEYAHDRSVIHRDIKPANLMLTRDKIVKIMDFGLARLLDEGACEKTTVKGTPYYMSPEQILGKNVDASTDLYALGCTLYHLVAGRPPFMDGDIYYHHMHSTPESPKKYQDKIPDSLAKIIMRCIEKDKSSRYHNPKEISDDLSRIAQDEVKTA